MAPSWIISTLNFKASAAALTLIEQRSTKRRRVNAIALAVQISVPTSSTCKNGSLAYTHRM